MAETLRKSLTSKGLKPAPRIMDPGLLIETEYIKNLQKQVYLLELETTFLKNKARKASSNHPRLAEEADQMMAEVKDLQSQMNTMQVELGMKEATISAMKGAVESQRRHLLEVSDASMREKSVLVEEVTQLQKLADVSVEELRHKEEEQKSVLHQLHGTIHSGKEQEWELRLLQTQLQEQIKLQRSVETQLAEKRSECLTSQAAVHQLEEQYLTTAQAAPDRVVSELRKEAEKLRTRLKEWQLTADEDKYLRNKMMEDCARLTQENGYLRSRVLEAAKQLEEERQLREQESSDRSKRISEITTGKEKERHLERTLSHWKRLVHDEKEKVAAALDQVLQLQRDRKSVAMSGRSLDREMTNLQNKHSGVQQENSLLRVEKNHLVERISQLHKQMAEKNDETRRMRGHVDSLCYEMDSLKLRRDLDDSSDKEAWQRLYGISHNVEELAAGMSFN